MKEKWILTNKLESYKRLSNAMNENPLVLRLLANRGIDTVEKANKFLNGSIKDLYNGFLMEDMKKGIDIIKDSIVKGEKIIIYGDYDCDGVISTVILYNALKACGANFDYYIPNREDEGYGMHSGRVRKLKEEGCEVILTCDNGIAAFEQVDLAKELGMKVIITDHHDIPIKESEEGNFIQTRPNADAVINHKRPDCLYPFKSLCGAGIALKFSQCLFKEMNIEESKYEELIEYAAIATVCDVVDLVDENRIIVKKGLELLNNTSNIGLKELYKLTGLEDKIIGEYHLGFVIGPCINATGRLETAKLSVELLITESLERAKELSKQLYELNSIRQELTQESAERVIERVTLEKSNDEKVIVIYDNTIHESIAGIVAGRVKERFNLPCIVLTKGKEMPKGSARSIECYNMFEELSKCKELLGKFGGHPMAAGLSLEEGNIDKLRSKINYLCKLTEEDVMPIIRIDSPLQLQYLNEELVEVVESLRPFGKGNPSPLFAVKDVLVQRVWLIGKDKNILKIRCKIGDKNISVDGISFDKFLDFKESFIDKYGEEAFNEMCNSTYSNFKMDLIYYPNINEFKGNKNIQLMIKNLRIN